MNIFFSPNRRHLFTRSISSTINNKINTPIMPLKKPFLSRFFNVLHYGTVALLISSSLFLMVNVIGAARAKKKSFRNEQIQGKAQFELQAEQQQHKKSQDL